MDSLRKASDPERNTTKKRHSHRRVPIVNYYQLSSLRDLPAESKPAGDMSAEEKCVEDHKKNEKKRSESTILPKKNVEEDDSTPTQQTTTPTTNNNNDHLLPRTKSGKIAPTSLELKQKDIIIYERAEMWVSAAQHMCPETITLDDMELVDDAWGYDRDDKGISGAELATPEASGMDATVQALARGLWMTVYDLGKSMQFVSGGGYL